MFKVIDIYSPEQCDKIVKSFKEYDVYYLSGYVKSFQIHGDGTPLLFYFEHGDTRAINVVIKKDISEEKHFIGKIEKNSYFHISTPYGYGGWIIEGEKGIKKLDEEYIEYCLENNIVSEFVRFNPLIRSSVLSYNIYDVKKKGNLIILNTKSNDIIWKNISRRTRTKINKTNNLGVKINLSSNIDKINEFIELYKKTMDRNKAVDYYYFNKFYFYELLKGLKNNFIFVEAVYNNILVASSIMIYANKMMTYHLGGSLIIDRLINPVCLAFYETAKWCLENDIFYFLLGGGIGGSEEDGLYRFKKAFNKNGDESFYIGKKIFDKQKYEELLNIRKKYDSDFDMNNSYLIQYLAD